MTSTDVDRPIDEIEQDVRYFSESVRQARAARDNALAAWDKVARDNEQLRTRLDYVEQQYALMTAKAEHHQQYATELVTKINALAVMCADTGASIERAVRGIEAYANEAATDAREGAHRPNGGTLPALNNTSPNTEQDIERMKSLAEILQAAGEPN
jgi:chromosome segregation ATPase